MKNSSLTEQQLLFCKKYVALKFNGKQAAIDAGYSKRSSEQQASRLLSKDKIQKQVAMEMQRAFRKIEKTADDVIKQLTNLGFSNLMNYISYNSESKELDIKNLDDLPENLQCAIDSITQITTENKAGDITTKFRIKLKDSIKPLELLGKHYNIITDSIDVTSKGESVRTYIVPAINGEVNKPDEN